MNKKVIKLTIIILCVGVLSTLSFAQETDSKKIRANEILTKSKNTINKQKQPETATGLSLNYKYTIKSNDNNQEWNATGTTDLYLISDKIRQDSYDEYETNATSTSLIINGDKFERNTEVFADGKKVNAAFTFSTPKEIQIKNLKNDAWIMTFPIFLDSFIFPNLEFSYVGIAESKDGRANVIQATIDDSKFQLFFDEKTNLLLMMTESWKNKENKDFQTKYFYSDYREESDWLFAHTIKFQSNNEKVGIGETTIKSLKINPTFKPNFFDVKEK